MKIYAVKLTNYKDKKTLFELIKYVEENKRKKIYNFKFLLNVYQTLIGDILLRYIICNELKLKNEQVKFRFSKFGKPFLINYDNFYFNLSHSGEWVVCVCNFSNVGIDIEKIQSIDFEVAKIFCTQNEFKKFLNIDENKKLDFFYWIWTLKESYVKAIGKGLNIPLDSFEVLIKNNVNNYFFKKYNIDDNYKLSVCSEIDSFPENIQIINQEYLIQEFCKYV